MNEGILLVLTTCADETAAAALAESLVSRRLAACVSAFAGVRSTWRWQGRIERGTETMLVIKTTRQRYPEVEAHIRSHSDYELPEVVAVRSETGLPPWLSWVHEQTSE